MSQIYSVLYVGRFRQIMTDYAYKFVLGKSNPSDKTELISIQYASIALKDI